MDTLLLMLKTNKDAINSAGTVFALVVFAFAICQYRRGESWKKSEFIAKLYKEFVDDMSCQRAMWMLDWGDRSIDFGPTEKPIVKTVTSDILRGALRKHDQIPFTDLEVRIRDNFDRFFSYIEQFERAIQNKLVKQQQVYPYFSYLVELLSGKRHLPDDVRESVMNYVDCYGYKDVKRFFGRWIR